MPRRQLLHRCVGEYLEGEGATDVERGRRFVEELREGTLADHPHQLALPSEQRRVVKAFASEAAAGRSHLCVLQSVDMAEQQIQRRLGEAQRLEIVGSLAGGIAHDFNNLLTAIQANVTLALEQLQPHTELAEDLGDTLRASERAADLTRQLLAFSRQQVLEPTVLDLNQVIRRMQRTLLRLIKSSVTLELELNPQLGRVKVDRGQMEQVILNLAVNASDAMPEGGRLLIETRNVELREEAATDLPTRGQHAQLRVVDEGIGMDEEVLGRIFEPFFTTKELGQGTGLGLATAYGIVTQSGGSISAESRPDVGTTFTVRLPVTRAEPTLRAARTTSQRALAAKQMRTVLVVEDEPTVLRAIRRVLSRMGFRVLGAGSPRAALALAARTRDSIDLLLSDVVMPEMSGFGLAEKVRRERPQIKVLLMSGYTGEALPGGFSGMDRVPFLAKPFTPDSLADKVREVLET